MIKNFIFLNLEFLQRSVRYKRTPEKGQDKETVHADLSKIKPMSVGKYVWIVF